MATSSSSVNVPLTVSFIPKSRLPYAKPVFLSYAHTLFPSNSNSEQSLDSLRFMVSPVLRFSLKRTLNFLK